MNHYIDHTNLKPFSTRSSIIKLCNEAIEFKFRGVCVNSGWIPLVSSLLKNTKIKIISTIGFPLGAVATETKLFEAKLAVEKGAHELDVVWNLGAFKNKNFVLVLIELIELAKISPIKVIVETCYLYESELHDAYHIVEDSGAQFIKTSTGFGSTGANFSTVKKLHSFGNLKIKASGGIWVYNQALELIEAGASVIGTSSGLSIIRGRPCRF